MRPIFQGRSRGPQLLRWATAVEYSTRLATVADTDRTLNIDWYSLETIDDVYEQPNTCSFECFGFTPAVGDAVVVQIGMSKEFAGKITRIGEAHYRPTEGRIVKRVSCIDHTYDLAAVLITGQYGSQSATTTATSILASLPAGFTTANVTAGLPTVAAIQFTETPLPDALSQLCDAFGGSWYVDEDKDIHLFITDPSASAATLNVTNLDWRKFSYDSSVEQLVNRILVEAAGATVAVPAAAGASSLSVADRTMLGSLGTLLTEDGQQLAFTGVTTSSTAAAKTVPAAPSVVQGTGGSTVTTGTYKIGCTYFDENNVESALGAVTTVVVSNPNASFTITIPTVSGGNSCCVYLSNVNTSTYFRLNAGGSNGPIYPMGTLQGAFSFQNDGATSPPASSTTYAAGSTSINVADTSVFTSGKATSGSNTFTYSGRSVAGGAGRLTGIPASGTGSIGSSITVSDTITDAAGGVLTGVSGVTAALALGAALNILVQRDDTTSQATYGIRRKYVQDRRLSIASAQARGDAELTLSKDPRITGSYTTEDVSARSGRTVTIAMSTEWGIAGTYRIQRVRKFFEPERLHMQRDVSFGNLVTDRDLYQLLRALQRDTKAT